MAYEQLKNDLVEYFKKGEKKDLKPSLGVEIEHFIVGRETKDSVPYAGKNGIGEIVRKLMAFYPDAKAKGNPEILGFFAKDFTVTLEPAAQLEISIMPFTSLDTILEVYETFRAHVEKVIAPMGYECITIGYQPHSKVEELTLIPSPRYHFMDRHMRPRSTHGVNMMRGTASTQVSVDYTDEADFRRKIQVAYALSPYMKLLTDNCPVFEGEPNQRRILRSFIWEHMDRDRAFFVPDIMKPDYGYNDYAAYILNIPMMFLPEELTGEPDRYTGEETSADYYSHHPMTVEDIEHMLSKTFPDVRLKQYVEIRFADSLPKDLAFGYIALIKGLFYNEGFLNAFAKKILAESIDEKAITDVLRDIEKNGWDAFVYGTPMRTFHQNMLEEAGAVLPAEEQHFLDCLRAIPERV